MAHRVVHFEIEAKDLQRAKKFYEDAFGWDIHKMGDEYGKYMMVMTGKTKEIGGINGGIYPQQTEEKEVNAFRCVIEVEDINKSMEDVKKAGGKVLNTPTNVPNVGLFASCIDTENNHFTLLQPSMDSMQKEEKK